MPIRRATIGRRNMLRVGACQTPEILGDIEAALGCIEHFARQSESARVDLLLFPECFLQGYLVEEGHLRQHALDLESAAFASILQRLTPVRPTLVFGMIELLRGRYFNSAVVIRSGQVVGVYRKTHLSAGESLFEPGGAFPVFELNGVTYGINICFDTNFADAAAPLAAQGARLMLVPSQNMMKRGAAEEWRLLHNRIRAERVKETGMWLVSADVTGARDDLRVAYGPTSVMNPEAEIVAQVPLMATGMVLAEIE